MPLTTVPTPAEATCTIPFAVTGPCGAPAVFSFSTSDGRVFHECADHCSGPITPAASDGPAVADRVRVTHIGVDKVGTVVKVGRTRVSVEVPIGRGRTASTKVIVVPASSVAVVR